MECPCCFQELPRTEKATVSLENNILIWSGLYAQFTPTEAEMLHVLADYYPGWVEGEILLTKVYGGCGDAPETGYKIFTVMCCKIRSKLQAADVPITVENAWGFKQGPHRYRLRYL